MKRFFLVLPIFVYSSLFGQKSIVINNDFNSDKSVYILTSKWYDGTEMSDAKTDNIIYKKINGKYYKKAYSIESVPQLFGAKGDAKYNTKGDINQLLSGTDDTEALSKFLNSRNNTKNSKNKLGGSSLYLPSAVYKTRGTYLINDSSTSLYGDGIGSTILHTIKDDKNKDLPFFTFKRSNIGSTFNDLLTGGGLEKMSLRTNNSSIRNYAINLVFTEYMTFRDLNIEGFGKSAVKGGLWEGYFDNIKIAGCGALQVADKDGNPVVGLIDISNDDIARPDGSNNTMINKLTFSSNFGTLLKLTSNIAQSVNFNIFGIYAETYFEDAGNVDELPLLYIANSTGNSIIGGFFTINSTKVQRNASVIKMNDISEMKLSDLTITFNPIDGFLKRPVRRLRNIADLKSPNSKLSFTNVIINDQVDGIGYGLPSVPPLIEGIGMCNLQNTRFYVLGESSGGTRRLTNIVDRRLKSNGSIEVIPTDKNGEIPSLRKRIDFHEGSMILYSEQLPSTYDTWQKGDKILKTSSATASEKGWICTQAGTSGILKGVKGTAEKKSKTLKVNTISAFLVGDWISISGLDGYNRIAAIENGNLILEQDISKSFQNADIQFYNPKWEILNCK